MEVKSFKQWLYDKLVAVDAISQDEYEEDELTAELVVETLELDTDEIETYAGIYADACEEAGVEPDWTDFEEYEV